MKVSVIAPIYNYYPILIPSLMLQTHENWECILLHDGPDAINLSRIVNDFADARVKLVYSDRRHNDWGHSLREKGLNFISARSDFVIHTNADNYYVPGALAEMLPGFQDGIIAVHCDMLHNYWKWKPISTTLNFGQIDTGCVMYRTGIAAEFGWKSVRKDADWDLIEEVIKKYGRNAFAHIPQILCVHN
jgi:glycosyltransferase involved in cell wall biosynthesis